ncbi:hypothetical protein Sipo8835_41815 [Streptomyces ipomoeae]|uniref:Uncharacterized protein n=1 Tax=Streptomyces ipomoeae TaxID=103232 RepID=A0AAE9AVV3_9ACTN|nr:hypothetical protein [Streptomyces ipomoeae]TQE17506.1 hypothetical protein Sipo8835_41815 [Streptomyces ipomoeae]TQE32365.1 hypothetical protein Sipo7851_23580 [Streptomyces ipomoeae]
MGTKVRLWRWRRNPLRRRSDAAEAWVILATGLAIAIAAPVTGAVTVWNVQDTLDRQRQALRSTTAVLTADAPAVRAYTGGATVRAAARWTAPDGTTRTGDAQVKAGLKAGDRATVWTDDTGALRDGPLSPAEVEARAGLSGALAAGGACAVLLTGSWVVRRRLDTRRAAGWEREWAEVGPRWARKHA